MKTMKYVGPHDAVEVPLGDGSYVVVENGGTGEFDDAVAASLAQQTNNWKPTGEAKPSKSAKQPESKTGEEDGN